MDNDTRLRGIYFNISKTVEMARTLRPLEARYPCDYTRLCDFAEDLWPAFLNHYRTPWDVPLTSKLGEVHDDLHSPDTFLRLDNDNTSGPFNAKEFCSIEQLLSNYPAEGKLWTLYCWLEQLAYYVRRHIDQFLEEHKPINDLLSRMMGECYVAFREHVDIYSRAYLVHQIICLVYGNGHPYQSDAYAVVLEEGNWHGRLGSHSQSKEIDMTELVRLHQELLKGQWHAAKQNLNPEDRDVYMQAVRVRVGTALLAGGMGDSGRSQYLTNLKKHNLPTAEAKKILADTPVPETEEAFRADWAESQFLTYGWRGRQAIPEKEEPVKVAKKAAKHSSVKRKK